MRAGWCGDLTRVDAAFPSIVRPTTHTTRLHCGGAVRGADLRDHNDGEYLPLAALAG
jgi:hypothetical protein